MPANNLKTTLSMKCKANITLTPIKRNSSTGMTKRKRIANQTPSINMNQEIILKKDYLKCL
jgi:hypothetical protein